MPCLPLRLISHLVLIACQKSGKRDSSGEDPRKDKGIKLSLQINQSRLVIYLNCANIGKSLRRMLLVSREDS